MVLDAIIQPFVQDHTMRLALLAVIYQSLSITPIGVFLVMRSMSLIGDALSHAILPGVVIGYMVAGMNILVMSVFGLFTGILIILGSTIATRYTQNKEDANFAGFYLSFLALGVVLVSISGTDDEIVHLLFGSLSQINFNSLLIIASIATFTLIVIAIIYRVFFIECVEPNFLKVANSKSFIWLLLFQLLVVLNLIGGFQTLGTLLPVGLMLIPAVAAKLWVKRMSYVFIMAFAIAFLSGIIGLLISYYTKVDSGAIVILCCGLFYIISILFGFNSGILWRSLNKEFNS